MIYFAWYNNMTSRKDDEWLKIEAPSLEKAKEIAERHRETHRFWLGWVNDRKWVKRFYPWLHTMEWGKKAVKE